MTSAERAAVNAAEAQRVSEHRANMIEEERAAQRDRDRERERARLAAIRSRVQEGLGEAIARSFPENIPHPFILGSRDFLFKYGCGALRFQTELDAGLCCNMGKVELAQFHNLSLYP